jgi:Glycosyltransferase
MSPLNIAEVIATFPPLHGGMGYVCYHNALQLSRQGHKVSVFTLDHGKEIDIPDPEEFQVHRIKPLMLHGDGGPVPQLATRLKKFDIVHLHYPFFGGAEYVYLASLLSKVPYFLTYHMDVVGNTPLKRAVLSVYNPLLAGRILRRANLVGAVTRQHLESSQAAPFVTPSRLVEIPNGVDTNTFHPGEKSQRLVEKHGLSGKTVVLFVGNLQPFKGIQVLIDAMAGIEDPDVVAIIVGGGYAEEQYRNEVSERRLEDKILFAGPQTPSGELPDYYRTADFLVLPSTHSESFGLVVLEAFASGKPAIVSALPGPAAIVDKGEDGLIAEVGDADSLREQILILHRDSALRKRMGISALKKAREKYTWEAVARTLEEAFHRIKSSNRVISA